MENTPAQWVMLSKWGDARPVQVLRKAWLYGWRAAYLLCAVLVLFSLTSNWSYDDPFITYRYAENIAQGHGPVYNEGAKVLSTTTPLLALVLSLAKFVWPNLLQVANLIGAASLAFSGLLLYEMAALYRTPAAGWFGLFFYPTFPLLFVTIGSETPLYISLILASIWAYSARRYSLAGFFSALAVLARPDGVLAAAVLAIHFLFAIRRPIPWKAIGIFVAINLLWFGFAWLYFGSPLPVTLTAKQHQGAMTISDRFIDGVLPTFEWYAHYWGYWLAAAAGLLGVWTILRRRSGWGMLLVWTAVYTGAYTLLNVSRYVWYYAPLVPGLVICAGIGLQFLLELARTHRRTLLRVACAAGLAVVLISLAFFQARYLWRFHFVQNERTSIYREVGEWLRNNSPAEASVATLEVGTIGYYSGRKMIDFAGLIQPDVARRLTKDTTYEDAAIYAVHQYDPDYIVLMVGAFSTLREQYIMKNCQWITSFGSDKYAVDLFACR